MTLGAEIVIMDTGLGNLRSVERAVQRAVREEEFSGVTVAITGDAGRVAESAVTVMPGQGAFRDCAAALARDSGALGRAITRRIERASPYLGICLGLHVLFEGSEEAPGVPGLGVFRGTVRKLREGLTESDGARVKVPHTGWNLATPTGQGARWIGPEEFLRYFYFVHSYAVVPEEARVVAATSDHGEGFVCAVSSPAGELLGVQFHPEKSQGAGITLLRRYLRGVLR